MPLVAQRRRRGQEEGAGDHGEDEREAEEEERVPVHSGAVRGPETVLQGERDGGGGGAELAGRECRHGGDKNRRAVRTARKSVGGEGFVLAPHRFI